MSKIVNHAAEIVAKQAVRHANLEARQSTALDHAALTGLNHHGIVPDAYAHTELTYNKDSETRFPVSGKTPFKAFVNPDDHIHS